MEPNFFTLPYPPPVIAPKGLLETFCTTGTHVCYISVLETYKDYRDFYIDKSKKGESVILDHSTGLNRISPNIKEILKWIDIIQPKAVVLPDFNYQKDRTLKESFKLLKSLETYNISTIGVIQGVSLDEIISCYEEFEGKVSVIGFPAGLEKISSRNDILYMLGVKEPCVYIEVYKSLLVEKPRHSNVELMWSSLPLRLAYEGDYISRVRVSLPDLDFSSHYIPEHAKINIQEYIDILTSELVAFNRV